MLKSPAQLVLINTLASQTPMPKLNLGRKVHAGESRLRGEPAAPQLTSVNSVLTLWPNRCEVALFGPEANTKKEALA